MENMDQLNKERYKMAQNRKQALIFDELEIMVNASKEALEVFKHSNGYVSEEMLETTAAFIKLSLESIFNDTEIVINRTDIDRRDVKEIAIDLEYEGEIVATFGMENKKQSRSNDLRNLIKRVRKMVEEEEEITIDQFCDPKY